MKNIKLLICLIPILNILPAESLCPVDIFQCKDKSSPDKEIYIGNKRARNKTK